MSKLEVAVSVDAMLAARLARGTMAALCQLAAQKATEPDAQVAGWLTSQLL
jgi:hypothetical protein